MLGGGEGGGGGGLVSLANKPNPDKSIPINRYDFGSRQFRYIKIPTWLRGLGE